MSGIALAAGVEAQESAGGTAPDNSIVVYGKRLPNPILDIEPDAELDENDIAAYGLDNVRQVIDQSGKTSTARAMAQ